VKDEQFPEQGAVLAPHFVRYSFSYPQSGEDRKMLRSQFSRAGSPA
jgi:hypothetical protein